MLSTRLQQIMEHYHLNPMSFSEKLQIQRSSLSHFFSGRNKPGWDFLEKLARTFPDVNIQWLLTGSGKMLLSSHSIDSISSNEEKFQTDKSSLDVNNSPVNTEKKETFIKKNIDIEKVIVFYSNGTCKIYSPN